MPQKWKEHLDINKSAKAQLKIPISYRDEMAVNNYEIN